MKTQLKIFTILVLVLLLIQPSLASGQENINLNSYIVIDAETGYVLYENNADAPYAPASITKVMTMYLIFEALDNGDIALDDIVVPGEQVRTVQHPLNTQLFLEPGTELFTVEELIKAIAVPSASDAAIAMAEHIAGSHLNFVSMMNDKATQLGLENTQFQNPHGLDAQNHYMSARDIAVLSQRLVIDYPDVLKYSSLQTYTPPAEHTNIYGESYFFISTFRDLLRRHPEVDGLKTGFTSQAGYCITTTANLDGRKYIIVIMGAETIDEREKYVADFMLKTSTEFQPLTVATANNTLDELPIPRSKGSSFPVGTVDDIVLVVPRGNPEAEHKIELNDDVKGPLKKGDQVGTITFIVNEQETSSSPVYVLEDVPQANIIVRFFRGIGSFFSSIFGSIKNFFF